MKKILLYYKYVKLKDPYAIKMWQKTLCEKLGLKGRIIVAEEGINGTVEGSVKTTTYYRRAMKEYSLFRDMDFKQSTVSAAFSYFPRLRVTVKKEICRLGIDPNILTVKEGGVHLSPQEAHELMAKGGDDLVILDTRNEYEWKIGAFKNAILPKIRYFREFPDFIEKNLEMFRGKKVLMYCTGGVRCERATAVLKTKNVAQEVYQIEGGIHRYAEQYPDGFFRGKNYVFDNRIAVKVTDDLLGTCGICSTPCDEYTNCSNAQCNKHFICCRNCLDLFSNTCSKKCKELVASHAVKKRPPLVKVTPAL